jgi:hypothetical protein
VQTFQAAGIGGVKNDFIEQNMELQERGRGVPAEVQRDAERKLSANRRQLSADSRMAGC